MPADCGDFTTRQVGSIQIIREGRSRLYSGVVAESELTPVRRDSVTGHNALDGIFFIVHFHLANNHFFTRHRQNGEIKMIGITIYMSIMEATVFNRGI